ncbi:DUF1361 domain-containing protein [Croceimicrobium hydrocarbonivorans]|uniref:DUF1361 domain-containing protein n=1 Tax=Croceimicrobium hydrocarbonivorans TaxID=2761580 RepID=A0A7H0VF87_9FLAO|nr:DUF1361 domain-containing protein [Croceimicrobium hydrocarbonivorans]QNR24385.1 DUF1361 domain-containing protein [Croceimicrobium hydrocarbonivorans]
MSKKFLAFLAFTVVLSIGRPWFNPGHPAYLFILWNLFLAYLPLFFAKVTMRLSEKPILQVLGLFFWLLFFPNAPYILTDLTHLDHSHGFDWYDTLLILAAGIAGIKMAFDSLDLILIELKKLFPRISSFIWTTGFMLLAAYGIYLGRFLRFNSWDILSQHLQLFRACIDLFLHPAMYRSEWTMILIFSGFLISLKAIWPKENIQEA